MDISDEQTQLLPALPARKNTVASAVTVILDGNGAWTDLFLRHAQGKVLWGTNAASLEIAGFAGDPLSPTTPTVAIRIELGDGRAVIAQATLEAFCAAADQLRAQYLSVAPTHGETRP